MGLSDRTLAEYIIHLAEKFPEPTAFRHALSENGAEFPNSLSDNLLRIIGAMKPSARKDKAKATAAASRELESRVPRNETEARFPGLAMANTKVIELEDGFGEISQAQQKREEEAAAAAATVAAAMKAKQAAAQREAAAAAPASAKDTKGEDDRQPRKRNRCEWNRKSSDMFTLLAGVVICCRIGCWLL